MSLLKKRELSPVLVAVFIFVLAQAIAFYAAPREQAFLEANQITPPQTPFPIALAYFLGAVAVLGIILYLIPVAKLRLVLRIVFGFLYSWGTFILLALSVPPVVAILFALALGVVWLIRPFVWLHNLTMVLALASIGAVFGFMFSPWTAIVLMLALSVYDILAVRSGYMLWLARKMSTSEVLPAFVVPRQFTNWTLNLKGGFARLFAGEAGEREFSLLGGGDIGFPLMLAVSVFANYGWISALVVSLFSLVGLIGAYWIQSRFLKGEPMPALPPISAASLIGYLIAYFAIVPAGL